MMFFGLMLFAFFYSPPPHLRVSFWEAAEREKPAVLPHSSCSWGNELPSAAQHRLWNSHSFQHLLLLWKRGLHFALYSFHLIFNFDLIWSWCNCVSVFRISCMNTVLVWATIQRNSFTKAGISNITLVFLSEILMTITKVQRFNNEADFIIISHKQAISYFRNPLLFPPQSQSILK